MDEPMITTDHLTLIPLTLGQLELYLCHSENLDEIVGCPVSRTMLNETLARAIRMKIDKMSGTDVAQHLWLTYWLIKILEDGFGAGMVGFKGIPDEFGEVEIGYGIDEAYRKKGYMTEAVRALIGWAFEKDECQSVVALGVLRENVASHRVLEKVGMKVYAESSDSLDWRIEKEWKAA
jgi:ribosomal-protein-alanine N-acetyltransferase